MNKKERQEKKRAKRINNGVIKAVERHFRKKIKDKKKFLTEECMILLNRIDQHKYISGDQWKKLPMIQQHWTLLFDLTSFSKPIKRSTK